MPVTIITVLPYLRMRSPLCLLLLAFLAVLLPAPRISGTFPLTISTDQVTQPNIRLPFNPTSDTNFNANLSRDLTHPNLPQLNLNFVPEYFPRADLECPEEGVPKYKDRNH